MALAFLQENDARVTLSASAGQTDFQFDFPIFDQADLKVIQVPAATGVETILALGPGYTVAGVGVGTGGIVTLVAAAALGDTLIIEREIELKRITDFEIKGDYDAVVINRELDRMVMMTQDLRRDHGRTLRAPEFDALDSLNEVPKVTDRALRLADYDAAGQPIPGPLSASVALVIAATLSTLQIGDMSVVPTSASLAAISQSGLIDNDTVYLLGQNASGDGGQRKMRYDAASSATHDGVTVVEPPGSPATGRWLALMHGTVIEARIWGVTADGSDETARIQAAVDYAMANGYAKVLLPNGTIKFTSLDLTGSRNGRIELHGGGRMAISNIKETVAGEYGTLLESTKTTGEVMILSDLAGPNYPQRYVRLADLTLRSPSSSYALQVDGLPEVMMDRVGVEITNAAGSIGKMNDVWFGHMSDCYFIMKDSLVGTQTGNGFDWTPTLQGGVCVFDHCLIDGFVNNFAWNSGTTFANLVFRDCAFQKHTDYGVLMAGPARQLRFENCYFETGAGKGYIHVKPSAGSVLTLSIDGIFLLGGTNTGAWITEAAIHLEDVSNYDINGVYYQKPWTGLLNVVRDSNGTDGAISNFKLDTSDNLANLPAGPLEFITVDHARAAPLIGSYNMTASSKLLLMNNNVAWPRFATSQALVHPIFAHGAIHRGTTSANEIKLSLLTPQNPAVTIVTATGAAAGAVALPNANTLHSDAQVMIVINDPASTKSVLIRNGIGGPTQFTLLVGQAAYCYADIVNDKWIVVQATAANI